jgi:hypothetical protein
MMNKYKWFEQAWIIQEVTVSTAARVYWGRDSVYWHGFVDAMDFAIQASIPAMVHPYASRLVPIFNEPAFSRQAVAGYYLFFCVILFAKQKIREL